MESGCDNYQPPDHGSNLLHDTLHGFRVRRGTGTNALEAKLLQHLTATREAVLFEVFLDIWKVYYALYQERALYLIALYGFGPRTVQLLRTYWDRLTMMANYGGYFGGLLKWYQGVTQDKPLSPTISNVVVESVIRH